MLGIPHWEVKGHSLVKKKVEYIGSLNVMHGEENSFIRNWRVQLGGLESPCLLINTVFTCDLDIQNNLGSDGGKEKTKEFNNNEI